MEKEKPVFVVIEGGIVQSVCTHNPKYLGAPIVVIDYDIEGAEPEQLKRVKHGGGQDVDAEAYIYLGVAEITQAAIEVEDA